MRSNRFNRHTLFKLNLCSPRQPFKNALHIELYNEKWFNTPIPTTDSPITYDHDTLKFPDKSPLPFPYVLELHKETNTCPTKVLLAIEDYSLSPTPSRFILNNFLTDSNCLFFIQYLPENTLTSCWFLVQINHIETTLFNMNSKRTDDYHVTLTSQYPNDNNLCDDKARWWPLWHEYKNDKNDVPIYSVRMLFGPKHKPDSNKYILRTDSIHLTDPSCYLHGTFNFDSHSDVITAKQHVALTRWGYFLTV